uniref:Sodium channel and clathrin linker 1 n=1 Tax=Leptobrachium leishanense TaxID=445787 RepID=A0A8C5M5Y7_9ANUR
MANLEIEFLRDQVQRLRAALKQYEDPDHRRHHVVQGEGAVRDGDTATYSLTETRNMASLIGEYDKHTEEMSQQLHVYQAEMGEMRIKLESIIKENERLHEQLKESLEKQLESFPVSPGMAGDSFTEQEVVKNLQDQLQFANKEKEHALELWHAATQEMDRVHHLYQEHTTQAHLHVAETQQQKEQVANFQQLTKQLQTSNERLEMTNRQFSRTVEEQHLEIEQLSKQFRQTKVDLRAATLKVEDLSKLIEDLQEQNQRKEVSIRAAHAREEASDKRVHELQSSLAQIETRLKITSKDVEQLKEEKAKLEKCVTELQANRVAAEEEKYEAVCRVHDSMIILEEANLQKDQALLREKQKLEEIENMKMAIAELIQGAAAKTRREVENTKKLFNVQISRLTEDVSALQMECGEKQSQIERALREKRAAEEELEKVYREARINDKDYRKQEELHQRCLIAERAKDDLQISLNTLRKKMRQLELNSAEELSRCQETVQNLNKMLESERNGFNSVSEERLKLVQENETLRKEVEEWKKSAVEVQHKITFQVQTMAHEFSLKEQGFEVQLKEMEDNNRKGVNELMKLLTAQQKSTSQWKQETRKLSESAESRLGKLRNQIKQLEQRNEELLAQVETAHEKNIELEKLVADYQGKSNRLQSRLQEAEDRELSATRELKLVATQRRKNNLYENI